MLGSMFTRSVHRDPQFVSLCSQNIEATFYFAGLKENPELGPSMGKAMAKYCGATRPAVTGVGVEALFDPTFHIEIQVEAFIPPKN